MERKRILIVEDDVRQITWAKESLKEHVLAFCENKEEFEKENINNYDVVMTDLFLPEHANNIPDCKVGLSIFSQLVQGVKNGVISKCALVSNLEGHLNKDFRENCHDDWEIIIKEHEKWMSDCKTRLDLNIGFYDESPFHRVTHFMSPEGNIVSKEKLEVMRNNNLLREEVADRAIGYVACKWNGYIILKPYNLILSELFS